MSLVTINIYNNDQKLLTMAEEILNELRAHVTATNQSLTNIREDITRIVQGLPQDGGLTAEEVSILRQDLTALSSNADTLDKENEPTV